MEKRIVLLTGATGFVASYLLKILLENGCKVYALARSSKKEAARARVLNALKFWTEEHTSQSPKNLVIVDGDITLTDLGIKSKQLIDEIRADCEIIFHSAALAKLRVELEVIRKINVLGTKNVLDFALKFPKLEKFNHISTAYVVGTKNDYNFRENELELGQGFNNTYEQTKYEAELLVQDYRVKGLNISVFRPSMVIGHSKTGQATTFRLFYEPIRFFSKEIYNEFPINIDCHQNLINIDTVAKVFFLLGDQGSNTTYHVVSPKPFNVGKFMDLASRFFQFRTPRLIPAERFDYSYWTPAQKILASPYIPYFNYTTKFCYIHTQKTLDGYNFRIPQITDQKLLPSFQYYHEQKSIYDIIGEKRWNYYA
ncbi:MAG: SDR family oxidoreductase [Candidatus Omnitrophica bacterium]|nr:SDR family oxidoreductase [Candidatus Omnitrophota bacterium]